MEQAHGAAADDHHVVAQLDAGAVDGVHHAGQGLRKGHFLERSALAVEHHVLSLGNDVLAEAAVAGDAVGILENVGVGVVQADVLISRAAEVAGVVNVDDVGHCSLSQLELVHAAAQLLNDAAVLMPADAGIAIGAVALVVPHVVGADARRLHADEDLVFLGLGSGNLGELNVAGLVHQQNFHKRELLYINQV